MTAKTMPRTLRLLAANPVAAALAWPHGVDRYLEMVDPLWSLTEVRARVMAISPETPDTVTVTLQPNDNWQGFRAGQYVRVGVTVKGATRTRCYSLSSSPLRAGGLVDITVKRQPGGLVSNWINERLAVGEVVTLSQAEGDFVLPDRLPAQLLFVAGGSGITPVLSMLRTLDAMDYRGRIDILYFVRRYEDVIGVDDLVRLTDADNRHLHLSLTGEAAQDEDLTGHFDPAVLAAHVPGYQQADTWVCGPAALIDAVDAHWQQAGIADRLRIERFAPAAAGTVHADAQGAVQFVRSGRQVHSDGRTLLDQAEAAGLRPEAGCRMGICHSCKCTKASGTVRDIITGEISSDDNESIRLCVSVPVGDVTLDI
jgi:ferredoxin-NADP reductase